MSKLGFTLMELLIVVAIIGILATISTVSYTYMQKKARDSRRATDLKAVQDAFELYYGEHNSVYPTGCALDTSYLPLGFPLDPKTGLSYVENAENATCTAAGYCICADLEGTTMGGNAMDTSCTFGSGPSFCIQNVQ